MNYPIADTHTHLYFSAFDADRDVVVDRCRRMGVQMQVQIGCDEVSSMAALDLANRYEEFYATLGVHPCDVKTCFDTKKEYRPSGFESYTLRAHTFSELFALFQEYMKTSGDHVVGFGETGFDLYHENSPEILRLQHESFEGHVFLARQFQKPLVFHIRSAREEFEQALVSQKVAGVRGVVHCFSEDIAFARRMTDYYGFFLGIGGVLTYPNSASVREAVKNIPLEFLVTETDSPFLVPQVLRKKGEKRNDASFLPSVIECIAELKNMDINDCAHQLFQNAQRLYGIDTEKKPSNII